MRKLAIAAAGLLLAACSQRPDIQKLEGSAQGTTYHISYWHDPAANNTDLHGKIEQIFGEIDIQLSNYRDDSLIERFNAEQNLQAFETGPTIVSLFRIAQTVHTASQGCYDLTIKPLFDLWGFKADRLSIPDDATIQTTLLQVGKIGRAHV